MDFKIFPLRELKNKKLKNHSIQRGLVWSPKQIGLLWDSILHEIPIGTFMLLKDGNDELVLDGQQRLNAISRGFGEYLQDNPDSVIWINFTKDKSFSFLTSSLHTPKFVGEQRSDALVPSHGHGSCHFFPIGHPDGDGRYGLCHVEHLVNAHADIRSLEQPFQLLI